MATVPSVIRNAQTGVRSPRGCRSDTQVDAPGKYSAVGLLVEMPSRAKFVQIVGASGTENVTTKSVTGDTSRHYERSGL